MITLVRLFLLMLCGVSFWYVVKGGASFWANWGREWRITEGRVDSFELKPSDQVDYVEASQVSILYIYTVDGTGYTGRRISLDGVFNATQQEIVRLWGSDRPERVLVYYSPDDPGCSFLIRGNVWVRVFTMMVAIVFGVLAGWRFWVLR